jgi:uncharacterized protein (DUF2141 family)
MNRALGLCVGLIMISSYAASQYNLEIEISDIKNNEGKIMLQLFDEYQTILTSEMSVIKDKKCVFTVKNLKPGKYAVRYYHDENVNGEMEKNVLGKPAEGYGFSNNVTGKVGPPPFEKWLFELKDDKKIKLKPSY